MPDKITNILVIDDLEDVESIFEVLKDELGYAGYLVNFEFLHQAPDEKFNITKPYDILLFDCYFPGSNLIKFNDDKAKKAGLSLIEKFRGKNFRTKVIFYSSTFDIENGKTPFDAKDFLSIINELNVFRMVDKKPEKIEEAIKDAINELDVIMTCMEDIYREYIDDDVTYELNGKEITIKDLLDQLKIGGPESEKFRKNVIESTLLYLMKFK